ARLGSIENAISEVLQSNLSILQDVRVVERERLRAVLDEQGLSASGLVSAPTAAKLGQLLGAERMIYGSFVELATTLRIEARLADTKTASILRAETVQGPIEEIAELLEDLALRLARDLSVEPPSNATQLLRQDESKQKIEAGMHHWVGEYAFHQGR